MQRVYRETDRASAAAKSVRRHPAAPSACVLDVRKVEPVLSCPRPSLDRDRPLLLLPPGVFERLVYYPSASRAAEYILANTRGRIRLHDVPAVAYMPSCSLSRFVSGKIGIRFGDFVRIATIANATKCLDREDYAISERPRELGYTSTSTFVPSVKAVMSVSPSEYRRHVAEALLGNASASNERRARISTNRSTIVL